MDVKEELTKYNEHFAKVQIRVTQLKNEEHKIVKQQNEQI